MQTKNLLNQASTCLQIIDGIQYHCELRFVVVWSANMLSEPCLDRLSAISRFDRNLGGIMGGPILLPLRRVLLASAGDVRNILKSVVDRAIPSKWNRQDGGPIYLPALWPMVKLIPSVGAPSVDWPSHSFLSAISTFSLCGKGDFSPLVSAPLLITEALHCAGQIALACLPDSRKSNIADDQTATPDWLQELLSEPNSSAANLLIRHDIGGCEQPGIH